MSREAVSTWGIPPTVWKILAKRILELRGQLEDDTRRQLAALGITADGIAAVPAGRVLAPEDAHAWEVVEAVIRAAREAGSDHEEAFKDYVRETAFTYLNRVVGLRCLEERGLLIVDGQPETVIKTDPVRGVASLAWRVRNEHPELGPRDIARDAFRRACAAITERIAVLFDPDTDHAILFPLAATVNRVSEVLNDPEIPASIYAEDEVLGWVYQYWAVEEKREVLAAGQRGIKIETPTQLAAGSCTYTPRYIVDYLLQNTLGALWTELRPDTKLRPTWPYYVTPPEGNEIPSREPKRVRDLTLLDPAVGSGHFLVRAFDLFRQLYEEEGREDPATIPALILERNLYGIDIDTRATQIAALALYAKAASAHAEITGDPSAPFTLRRINLVSADITLPPGDPPADLLAELPEPELQEIARALWTSLQGARDFGSLLHPERSINETFAKLKARDRDGLWIKDEAAWAERRRTLIATLVRTFEREAKSDDLGQRLFGEQASRGLSFVQALRRRYDVVVANPPYAGFRKLGSGIRAFLAKEYPDAALDLYTAFIVRCQQFLTQRGLVGMVTPQSWYTSSRTLRIRQSLFDAGSVTTAVSLGQRTFDDAGLLFVGLFTWEGERSVGPTTFRFGDGESAKVGLGAAVRGGGAALSVDVVRALETLPILPEGPPAVLEAMRRHPSVGDAVEFRDGFWDGENERYTRTIWEAPISSIPGRYSPLSAGKGYGRWWRPNHMTIQRASQGPAPARWEYARVAGGKLSSRYEDDSSAHLAGVVGMFSRTTRDDARLPAIGLLFNSRVGSLFLRILTSGLNFNPGYAGQIPLPEAIPGRRASIQAKALVDLARHYERQVDLADQSPSEFLENGADAIRFLVEATVDLDISEAFGTTPSEMDGYAPTPAGWHPLIAGYDALPDAPEGIELPDGLTEFLATLEHRTLSAAELATLKSNLQALYVAGPGAKVELEDAGSADSDDDEGAALGARIPIPTETFLEELSQRLEIHPISVHWLLTELREQDGVISPPLRARELDDYLQVTILRILGYRWPAQDVYEAEHGPLLPPDLVDTDGIVPLVPIDDQTTMANRIRDRLERQFGEPGAEAMLRDIKRYLKRDLDDWIRRDFLKSHIPRVKQRPIAWHLTSPAGEFAALVLYHRLSRQTLERLRAQYAGDRIKRLGAELARAQARDQAAEVSRLRAAIEDVEEFQRRIEAIERGATLADRIRCRWKDEEADGRPGPYAPDIDDGVKVNIRPFQEAGLLAVKTVIKKW